MQLTIYYTTITYLHLMRNLRELNSTKNARIMTNFLGRFNIFVTLSLSLSLSLSGTHLAYKDAQQGEINSLYYNNGRASPRDNIRLFL